MTAKERIAELRKFVNSFEGDVPIINALNDLDALEKLVEGEWGLLTKDFYEALAAYRAGKEEPRATEP